MRYLELAHPPQILAVTPPLRILGLIASPEGLDRLDVELEKQRVEKALADLLADGLIELHWLEGQTRRDLQRAMRRGPWHIFHYIGHGGFDPIHQEGLLFLADAAGQAEALTARQLATILGDHSSLRTVFLNACEGAASSQTDLFSGTAATLMRRGIPAVLAMQYAITDRAAIEFTTTLYESLADGYPVNAAVTEARKAISLAVNHSVEWGTPVLHMRAPDGQIFELQGGGEGKRQNGEGKSGSGVVPVVEVVRVPAEVATVRASVVTPPAPQSPIQIDWVTIPAGEFLMGSDQAKDSMAYDDELPQHRVYLPEYRISRTPVTNSQYLHFVEAKDNQYWRVGMTARFRMARKITRSSLSPGTTPRLFADGLGRACPRKRSGKRRHGARMGAFGPGAMNFRPLATATLTAMLARQRRSRCTPRGPAPTECWIWRVTFGSGRKVCGGKIPRNRSTAIPTGQVMDVRTYRPPTTFVVCCVGGRSSSTIPTCVAPVGTSSTRTSGEGTSGFVSFPPAVDPLSSVFLWSLANDGTLCFCPAAAQPSRAGVWGRCPSAHRRQAIYFF